MKTINSLLKLIAQKLRLIYSLKDLPRNWLSNIPPRTRYILRKIGLISPLKILYLSCHSTLEYDEVNLLREIGYQVFSPGDYVDEQNRGNPWLRNNRCNITLAEADDLLAFNAFGKQGPENKNELIRSFVDRFDIIIVMHMPKWIILNWEVMKHKTVIWRTIGQSTIHIENELATYRQQGLKIIRYSPMEKFLRGYIGSDATIRFYKSPKEYSGWTGDTASVMTIAQNMPERADACHYDVFLEVIKPFPAKLYGPGNEDVAEINVGKVSYNDLKTALRLNRCYFYTGTFPASYTLGFIEAWMTGIPIVAIGQKLMHDRFPNENLYEIPYLITPGVDGFYADSIPELQEIIQSLLNDQELANRISIAGRASAIQYFGKNTIQSQWISFLRDLN
jgi:glycosyltransferase involved in cell wall biosynthesis